MSLVQAFVSGECRTNRAQIILGLTEALLRAHGAEDNERARQLTWVLVHEVPVTAWGTGGTADTRPRSLTIVREPIGSLTNDTRAAIAREVHDVWVTVYGKELATLDAWVIIEEVPDGRWCADGHVLHLRDIDALLALGTD